MTTHVNVDKNFKTESGDEFWNLEMRPTGIVKNFILCLESGPLDNKPRTILKARNQLHANDPAFSQELLIKAIFEHDMKQIQKLLKRSIQLIIF
jgi:hypothetical protein